MTILIVGLLAYLIGTAQGFYARTLYDKIIRVYALFRDRMETPAGVVKPIVTRGQTRGQLSDPINLEASDEGGGVLRPSPNQIALQNMKEREARVRNL